MKKVLLLFTILLLILSLAACGKEEPLEASEQVSVKEDTVSEETQKAITNNNIANKVQLIQCGEEYKDLDLSYNVYSVNLREDGEIKHIVLDIEVFNHSSEDVDFNPMMRLALYNKNGLECNWNMMIGKLSGVISPNNKIKGEVAYEITGMESDVYILHIGNDFELKDAISISDSDIDQVYPEIFEVSGVKSEFSIGQAVESPIFDMVITGASIMETDKEGKEILLINLSMKNNDSEAHSLGFEIVGVYTSQGESLATESAQWSFTKWPIESQETETGIVSYYIPEDSRDFYMTVKPNIKEFKNTSNIVFSVD